MSKWTFTYGIRIDFWDGIVPGSGDLESSAAAAEMIAAADIDRLAADAVRGIAFEYAASSLVARWKGRDERLDFDRDIAPRISLAVALIGFDQRDKPLYGCAFYDCTVVCEDEAFARELMGNAADEWEEGDTSTYGFRQVEEAV